MSAVDGSGRCCTVGCSYASTVVQVGKQVTENFKEGDNIEVSTRKAASAGRKTGCLHEHCVGNGAGYYNEWQRVEDIWPSRTP